MTRACTKKFVNDHPGWTIDDGTGDGFADLRFNLKTDNAPILDGETCTVQILLSINPDNGWLSSWVSAKYNNFDQNEDFSPSVPLLKEIIPIIDRSLKLFIKYLPDGFYAIDFSAISFPAEQFRGEKSLYFQYVKDMMDHQNEFGDTELIKLVKNIHDERMEVIDAVVKLIDLGCDPDICNNDGESTLSLLREYEQDFLIAYIEKNKLDKDINEDEMIGLGL